MIGWARCRTAIVWYGAFEDGYGATIGDLHAVENLSTALAARGVDHVIATELPLSPPFRRRARRLVTLDKALDTIVFVCGPLLDDPLGGFLDRHPAARKVAVGVSVLDNQPTIASRFDAILPRDGAPDAAFDLALPGFAGRAAPTPTGHNTIGLCFRGSTQCEYGELRPPLHEKAESLLSDAARHAGHDVFRFDTVIHPRVNPPEKILRSFEAADIVATTRMHGALYALANGRPAIAIDQIPGGAKVSTILQHIGWPLVFRADEVNAATIEDAFAFARSPAIQPIIAKCREQAISLSRAASDRAADLVASLVRRRRFFGR